MYVHMRTYVYLTVKEVVLQRRPPISHVDCFLTIILGSRLDSRYRKQATTTAWIELHRTYFRRRFIRVPTFLVEEEKHENKGTSESLLWTMEATFHNELTMTPRFSFDFYQMDRLRGDALPCKHQYVLQVEVGLMLRRDIE